MSREVILVNGFMIDVGWSVVSGFGYAFVAIESSLSDVSLQVCRV